MKIKKIGRYLLDNQACEQKDVTAALEKQSNLESLGKYKPWAKSWWRARLLRLKT